MAERNREHDLNMDFISQPKDRGGDRPSVDSHSYADLYRKHVRSVFRYLYSRVRNEKDAEDLTAQVFLEALEGLQQFRYGSFSAWLFGIVRRKAADYFRERQPDYPIENMDGFPGPVGEPLKELLHTEDILRLAMTIDQLNEVDRELLRLRFVADLTFPQIGSVLDRNPDAVKKQIYRLLDRLKRQMEVDDE